MSKTAEPALEACPGAACRVYGFTLMEVLLVLVIMSLGLGLFLGANYQQQDSLQGRAFVSELSQFLSTARSHALLDGLQNTCIYDRQKGLIREDLRGDSLKVPQAAKIRLQDPASNTQQVVLATFYPNGSLMLQEMLIEAKQHTFCADIDRLLGRVQFKESS